MSNQFASFDDVHVNAPSNIHVTVYGADWCTWTRRQKEELENAEGVTYDYKDCSADDAGDMCADIKGLPTNEVNGVREAGYKPVKEIIENARKQQQQR